MRGVSATNSMKQPVYSGLSFFAWTRKASTTRRARIICIPRMYNLGVMRRI